MEIRRRRDIKPGQAFLVNQGTSAYPNTHILVVINDRLEVDFWNGTISAWGDAGRNVYMELL